MPKSCCCICLTRSGRFRSSASFESFFSGCFEVSGRTGLLCDGCRKCVYDFRSCNSTKFTQRVDSRKENYVTKKNKRSQLCKKATKFETVSAKVNTAICPAPTTLDSLPEEVLIEILKCLSFHDLIKLGTVNKKLYALSRSTKLWKNLTFFHFGDRETAESSWYDAFVCFYRYSRHLSGNSKSLGQRLENCELDKNKQSTRLLLLENKLGGLTDSSTEKITPFEERVFRCLLEKKEKSSVDGLIRARNVHGRPRVLAPVRIPEISSSEASARTIRERSKCQEKLLSVSTTLHGQSDEEQTVAINTQRTSLINRNKENYANCCKQAGLKIFAKFTPSEAAGLKAQMSLETWRLVKRAVEDVTGVDLLGTEAKLREKMDSSYHQFECGTFTTTEKETQKVVTFVRVTNIKEVVLKTIQHLSESNELASYQNIPQDCLSLLLCGDKGAAQTKLMLTVLNSKLQHSVKRSKLIAIFEGAKDSPDCIETVFGPLLQQLNEFTSHSENIKIPYTPEGQCQQSSVKSTTSLKKKRLASRRRRRKCKKLYGHKSMLTNFGGSKSFPTTRGTLPADEFSLDSNNNVFSVHCKCCQKSNQQPSPTSSDSCSFTSSKVVHGGDWGYLQAILKYTGANGVYFCPFCLIRLADLKKGEPHAPVTLPRYTDKDSRQPQQKMFPVRTLERMTEMADSYTTSGLPKEQVSQFENCGAKPIVKGNGPVIDHCSVMPLHLSLGIGLHLLNIAEGMATALDLKVREDNGLSSDEVVTTMEQLEAQLQEQEQLEEHLSGLKVKAEQVSQQLADLKQKHPEYEARTGTTYTHKTREAVEGRKSIRELKQKHTKCGNEQKLAEKSLKDTEQKIKTTKAWLEKQKGQFGKKFEQAMDSLNLKRQIYHSGALVGGDINTVFSDETNMKTLSSVFNPSSIALKDGALKTYSSYEASQKINTMFHKFAHVYSLMSPSRPLCSHEVLFLKVRCISFGNWLPTTFPEQNMKRKFHILTYHVPEKANKIKSVGMEAEHVSESIHPVVNSLKRRYATVQNMKQQLELICKGQWLLSDPMNPDYRKSKKHRQCSRCGGVSHYGKSKCPKQR